VFDRTLDPDIVNARGPARSLMCTGRTCFVLFHPTTTEYGGERRQMEEILEALREIEMQSILLWPNIDAGRTT